MTVLIHTKPTRTIFVVDNQLDVYSMRIADLLVRMGLEFEGVLNKNQY